jgi:hypothetical protein
MEKAEFNNIKALFTRKLDLTLYKKKETYLYLNAAYGA